MPVMTVSRIGTFSKKLGALNLRQLLPPSAAHSFTPIPFACHTYPRGGVLRKPEVPGCVLCQPEQRVSLLGPPCHRIGHTHPFG